MVTSWSKEAHSHEVPTDLLFGGFLRESQVTSEMLLSTAAPWEICPAPISLNTQHSTNVNLLQRKGMWTLFCFFLFVNCFFFIWFLSVCFLPSFLPHFFGLFQVWRSLLWYQEGTVISRRDSVKHPTRHLANHAYVKYHEIIIRNILEGKEGQESGWAPSPSSIHSGLTL